MACHFVAPTEVGVLSHNVHLEPNGVHLEFGGCCDWRMKSVIVFLILKNMVTVIYMLTSNQPLFVHSKTGDEPILIFGMWYWYEYTMKKMQKIFLISRAGYGS